MLGAGDAFMAGFLRAGCSGEDYDALHALANACGALVVSRHGCAPAMPTRPELDHFLANAARSRAPTRRRADAPAPRRPRRARAWPELLASPSTTAASSTSWRASRRRRVAHPGAQAAAGRGRGAHVERAQGIEGRFGVLLDGRFGADALARGDGPRLVDRPAGRAAGSRPLRFEHGGSVGTHAAQLAARAGRQVPGALPSRRRRRTAARAGDAAAHAVRRRRASGHELLLEVIPPAQCRRRRPTRVLRAMKRLYDLGIKPDWWKLEPMPPTQWQAHRRADRRARPVLPRRGAAGPGSAPVTQLSRLSRARAAVPAVKGFAVGRTIFDEPARAWLAGEIDDAGARRRGGGAVRGLVDAWRIARDGPQRDAAAHAA